MKRLKPLALTFGVLLTLAFITIRCKDKSALNEVAKRQEPALHPLHPLDTNEIKLAKQILLDDGKVDTTYRFYIINLNEPPKAEMLKYKFGGSFRREAFVSVYDRANNKTYESVVDLIGKKTLSYYNVPGVTPGAFMKDSISDELLKANAEWMAGLKARGIHPDSVDISNVFAGDLGIAPPDHRELICAPQYKNKKYHDLIVDGLVAYVDLTDQKVPEGIGRRRQRIF
jgi:primary-amine oxidase